MIFINNKYTKWYNQIITRSTTRSLSETYFERHHIHPKSIGGSNAPENIVKLTAKEHFVCHLLLTKMTCGEYKSKMVYAARMLAATKNNGQAGRYRVTGRIYDIIKKEFSKIRKGVELTDSVRTKISKSKKGKQPTMGMTGLTHSEETISKMRESRKRQIITDETKLKLSDYMKQVTQAASYVNPMDRPNVAATHKAACVARSSNKKLCIHCKQLFSSNTFARWHGDNCKLK